MVPEKRTILVATHNRGKLKEYRELLTDLDVTWVGLSEVGIDWDIDETGVTFEENAILKATGYSRVCKLRTLADDSGLEVDVLGGEPGVYSARFGGAGLNSEDRYRLLLEKLAHVPWEQRGARFRCVVALADGASVHATASGAIEGRIALNPSGSGGFGYDPVFYVSSQQTTMAELPAETKNRISHRARALAALRPRLEALLEA